MQDDQRLLHQRDECPLAARFCMNFTAGDRERPTRFHDVTFCQQPPAGASKFSLNSTVSTELFSGKSVKPA